MKSLETKGDKYAKGFFLRRFLPVWIQFAFIVLLFLIEGLCLGTQFTWDQILLSFTGWTSLGNSNWYMFITFALYILIMLVFLLPKLSLIQKNIIFTLLSCGLVIILYFTKESWWYNTLLCFNLGMWYCTFKDKIDILMRKHLVYWITLAITLATFIVLFIFRGYSIAYVPMTMVFCLLIVLLSMKIESRNPILKFFGNHVFSVYMLQRLVFIPLARTPLLELYPLYFIVCLAITVAIAWLFDFGYSKLHKKYLGLLDGAKRAA